MPEDMNIWQGRNVSCDVLQLLDDGFMGNYGQKEADGCQGKRKCRKRLLFG